MHAYVQNSKCQDHKIELAQLFDDAAEMTQSEDKKGRVISCSRNGRCWHWQNCHFPAAGCNEMGERGNMA